MSGILEIYGFKSEGLGVWFDEWCFGVDILLLVLCGLECLDDFDGPC